MAIADAIGELFVKISPDLSGFGDAVATGTEGATSRVMSKVQTGSRVALGAVTVVGGALLKMGDDWDSVSDQIMVQTGATGDELASLEGVVKSIASNTPNDFDKIGVAVAGVNQVLGLSGDQLDERATQFLELSRITGEDLQGSMDAVTGVFNQFGVSAEDQGAMLDKFFRISQDTGVGVTELAESVRKNGATLGEFGLSVEDSAALIGTLGENGIDAQKIMPGLTRVLKDAAAEGIPASDALATLSDNIKNASSDADATAIAIEAFGAKSGPLLAKQIRAGQLSFEDLAGAVGGGTGTIVEAGEETADWAETLTELKNKVFIALQPAASKLFGSLGEMIGSLSPVFVTLVNAIVPLIDIFASMPAPVQASVIGLLGIGAVAMKLAGPIGSVISVVKALGVALMANPWAIVAAAVIALAIVVVKNWDTIKEAVGIALDWMKAQFQAVVDFLRPLWEGLWSIIGDSVMAAWKVIKGVIDLITSVFTGDWAGAWEAVKKIFTGVWDGIKAYINLQIEAIKLILRLAWETIKGVASGAWEGIKSTLSGAIDGIVSLVSGLPGRLLNFLGSLGEAGLSIGKEIIQGIGRGLSNAVGIVGDFGKAVANAAIGAINSIIDKVNNALEFTIPGPGPLPDIHLDPPDIPRIPRLHSGGIVPGRTGEEVPTLLKAGEGVFTRDQMAALGLALNTRSSMGGPAVQTGDIYLGNGRDDLPQLREELERIAYLTRIGAPA